MDGGDATAVADWPVKRRDKDTGALLYGSDAYWHHQLAALKRSSVLAAFAFEFDPGLGKTATVIGEAGRMFLAGEIDTLIVIAPNRVHAQWINALKDWADFPWRGMAWPRGGLSSEKRKEQFRQAMRFSDMRPALRVFTINYENVRWPLPVRGRARPMPAPLKLIHDHIVKTSKLGVYTAVDESQRIKDHRAQQTNGIMSFGRGVSKVRRRLTGTPILQGVHDLYSQSAFLDPAIIGEESFWSFRAVYCKTMPVPGGRPGQVKITGARNVEALMRRLAPFTARVKKEDALDMPPKLFDRFFVEMDAEQARHYLSMEEVMMTGLRTGEHAGTVVTAKIVLTQLQKLLQIASGFIHDDNGKPIWISDAKVEAIREKVDELNGEHVVVWAPFIPLLGRLMDVLAPFKPVRFTGLDDVATWAKKGGPLVANQMSGGVGVDGMQVAHRAFYAANGYHLEHRLHSIDRIHRGEQGNPCFYTDFMAEGTKDEAVLKVLAAKQDVDNMTVAMLKKILGA